MRGARRASVPLWKAQQRGPTAVADHPPPPISTGAERPDFTDAIILRKGASVEHVVSRPAQMRGWRRFVSLEGFGLQFSWPPEDTHCSSGVAKGSCGVSCGVVF